MKAWLHLVRWKNLFLILITQILILQFVYPATKITPAIYLFLTYTLLFTAAGNIINDYFDVITDSINKPHRVIVGKRINPKTVFNTYLTINSIGFFLNLLSFYQNHNILLFSIVTLIMILLYGYSKILKGKALIGNITIATLTALSVFLFTLIIDNSTHQTTCIYVLSFFAFMLNLSREIVKDLEDIKGDKAAGLKTLPILIGVQRTTVILKTLIISTALAFVLINSYIKNNVLKVYILLFLVTPLLYGYYLLRKEKKLFSKISNLLKLIIAFGIFTVLFV